MTHAEAVKRLVTLTNSDRYSLTPPWPSGGGAYNGDWGDLHASFGELVAFRLKKWKWMGGEEQGTLLLGSVASLMLSRVIAFAHELNMETDDLLATSFPTAEGTLLRIKLDHAANRLQIAMSRHRDQILS